jgi:lipopolysaccharide biosynthesis regulator YciM
MAAGALAVAAAIVAVAVSLLAWERYRRRQEARAWLTSVRSVISGDPDAAIEALSDAARLRSPEAVDTYLALGQLFRRTGDLSRALRLHRNMLLGPDLPAGRRAEVERELAEDYRRSGMLAEAAEIYRRLAPRDAAAAVGLREVLVEGGDFPGAIEVQRSMAQGDRDPVLAHLVSARARELLQRDRAAAAEAASQAVAAHDGSADAWLATAEVAAAGGDAAGALAALSAALERDPRCALLAWGPLAALPDPVPVATFVEGLLAARPEDAALHLLRGRALARLGRDEEALGALRRALALDSSGDASNGLRELLQDPRAEGPGDLAARHALLVEVVARRSPPLHCRRCGAGAAAHGFRCGICGAYGLI